MDNFEKTLHALFDLQRFAGNERLDKLIRRAVPTDGSVSLDDNDLELNAAGESDVWRMKTEDDEKP